MEHRGARVGPSGGWTDWKSVGAPYTVGVEEEVMLLTTDDLSLAQRSDDVIRLLSPELAQHTAQETHAGVLELRTGVHSSVSGAVRELWQLRRRLAAEVSGLGIAPAGAGIHPLAAGEETRTSGAARYQLIADEMRCLSRREPTMALHVHVGVPAPDDAARVLRRIRDCLPLLLALSANSPFSRGSDTGFASARIVIFDGFPRTGPPRPFSCYRDYVDAIDVLIASGAIRDPTFLWWDARLQPALGTVEVRVMDAQSTVADIAPLVALVQSLARLELEHPGERDPTAEEVLAENRFLAARDGLDARLIDVTTGRLTATRTLLAALIEECRAPAAALDCSQMLDHAYRLAAVNGAVRQRSWVAGGRDLASMLARLSQQFTYR
jgi:glutamate---cysteine ligase / carboxylate-amine ligase